jgi:hypothetical protein
VEHHENDYFILVLTVNDIISSMMKTHDKHVEKTNEENESDKGSIQINFQLASSNRVQYIVGSIPGRVKPQTALVFVASPQSIEH